MSHSNGGRAFPYWAMVLVPAIAGVASSYYQFLPLIRKRQRAEWERANSEEKKVEESQQQGGESEGENIETRPDS